MDALLAHRDAARHAAKEQPQWLTAQSGLAADLGAQNILPTLAEALRRAKEIA